MFTHFDCAPFNFRYICTTVTNYWLKFFSARFLFRSHAPACSVIILFGTNGQKSKRANKAKNQIPFWPTRNAPKNISNIWPNSIWYSECVHKLKSHTFWPIVRVNEHSMVWLFLAAFIFEILTFNLHSLRIFNVYVKLRLWNYRKITSINIVDFISLAQPFLWIGRVSCCFFVVFCCLPFNGRYTNAVTKRQLRGIAHNFI